MAGHGPDRADPSFPEFALKVSRFHSRPGPGLAARISLVAAGLVLSACTAAGGTGPGAPSATPSTTTLAAPALAIPPLAPFDSRVRFSVTGGTLQSVSVRGHLHGAPLPGQVQAGGTSWLSQTLPVPSASYDVTAQVKDSRGAVRTLTGRLRIATLAAADTLGYAVTPFQGWIVGVNAPIVIRFTRAVPDRAAVERALTVSTSTPLVGSWHWVNSSEVHFRPALAWPAHSQVRVVIALQGVRAGPSLWAATTTTMQFTVGDAHLTRVDGAGHTVTVLVSGRTVGVWPTSLGRPQFATRSGNYVVLDKEPSRRMTSCSAAITCSPSNPNFYDLTVNWDVRLTYSGTFIHSAPWSVSEQGVENVSHGCINLSPAHAQAYFAMAQYGDLVTVSGTTRSAADLVRSGDPGMADWNEPWAVYAAASALGGAITTQPLPAG